MITKIKYLIYENIIESKSVHDLESCKCGLCYIDGGNYYAQRFRKIVKVLDDGTETIISENNKLRKKHKI